MRIEDHLHGLTPIGGGRFELSITEYKDSKPLKRVTITLDTRDISYLAREIHMKLQQMAMDLERHRKIARGE